MHWEEDIEELCALESDADFHEMPPANSIASSKKDFSSFTIPTSMTPKAPNAILTTGALSEMTPGAMKSMAQDLIILEVLRDFTSFFGDFHECCAPDPFGNVAMDPLEYETFLETCLTAALTPPREPPAIARPIVVKKQAVIDNSRELAKIKAQEKRKLKELRAREKEIEKKRRKKDQIKPRANANEVFQYVNTHANSNFWRSLKKFATIEIGPTPIPAKRFVQKPGKSQNYWLTVLKWASVSGRSNEWHSRGKMEEVFGKELYHCCRFVEISCVVFGSPHLCCVC